MDSPPVVASPGNSRKASSSVRLRDGSREPTKVTILRLESKDAGRIPIIHRQPPAAGPLLQLHRHHHHNHVLVAHPPPPASSSPLAAPFPAPLRHRLVLRSPPQSRPFSPPPRRPPPGGGRGHPAEARRLVRLVGVEALKRHLRDGQDEVVGYSDLLDACVEAGAARTHAEAEALARAMDDAGVVLLFRDKAYLHPEKLAELPKMDPRKEEFKQLQQKKEEIDKLAHKQVRRVPWKAITLTIRSFMAW
ncbi:hypothetical protein HU200_030481 [Digitaria exilis]|uniref:Calcium uniporter protein n=1 Tax=Digitaria exilis TaxID=1010633 RepID=A0A835ES68_9POAL|nr:hypothetical protein HU200_030481 [Digitaria exilis]